MKQFSEVINQAQGYAYPRRLYWNIYTKTWDCRYYSINQSWPPQQREGEVVVAMIRYSGDIPTYRQALSLRQDELNRLEAEREYNDYFEAQLNR